MRRLLAVGLIAVLLIGSLPALGATQSDAPTTPRTITTSQEFDDVEFHIYVFDNGSAQWTFRYERTLNNQQERNQFQQFANEFNNSKTELYTDFQTNAVELTDAGGNATGRVMKAENFSKNAYIGGLNKNRGVVEMSFKWTAFAAKDDGSIVIGDVFKGGLYLGENQTLTVEAQEGMKFKSAKPMNRLNKTHDTLPKSDTVSWSGPREFNDQRPMVEFAEFKDNPAETTTTTPPGGASQPGDGENPNAESPMMLFIAAVVLLIGLAAVFAWRQGNFGTFSSGQSTPGGGGGAATPTEPSAGTSKPAVSDEELLTDEARVKKLLRENGGRMKQVNIVEETGWSKSKVSMLLSEMEDEGEISKLRVGRENIISLDGHEPDAAGSPLDR
ncbi:helix-turn-helix transcriptional regulator [Haladaptatus sp. DFWS20]|uniref:helix-turn-helix transcriptional regulator n=1 Tax=Haladaptatus sp. DFWS20 TaxID=3403467 RepID=UPI003EBE5AF0